MSVYQDKRGRWVVDFVYNGRRIYRRCPPGATAAEARQYEAQLRQQLWHLALGRKPPVPIAAALELYLSSIRGTKSERTMRAHALRLEPALKGRDVSQAPQVAQEFIAWARAEGYSVAAINRSLATLKRACALVFRAGHTDVNHGARIELVPGERARHRYLTPREIERICRAEPRIADAVRIAVYTGLRLGELMRLTSADVRDGLIHLGTDTKTGQPRVIPIHPRIRAAVKRLPIPWHPRTLQRLFQAAAARAGIRDVRWHDLRHTLASWLVQRGATLPEIGAILGHASPQTTARYAHLSVGAQRRTLRRLR